MTSRNPRPARGAPGNADAPIDPAITGHYARMVKAARPARPAADTVRFLPEEAAWSSLTASDPRDGLQRA